MSNHKPRPTFVCECRDHSFMRLATGHIVLFDIDDTDLLAGVGWGAKIRPHAVYCHGWFGGRVQMMHRVILDAPKGADVDHINRNGLDNRRPNLRLASRAENVRNSGSRRNSLSKYKGVCRFGKRWRVEIGVLGTRIRGGQFNNEEDAARCYDRLALQHHGPFAYLNFPAPPITSGGGDAI